MRKDIKIILSKKKELNINNKDNNINNDINKKDNMILTNRSNKLNEDRKTN